MATRKPTPTTKTVRSSTGLTVNSAQPLYAQVRDTLRSQILGGTFAPNERIPSESDLTQSFGVSRITVRQALQDLQNAGLIFTVHGKGTFATKPKAIQNVEKLQGFEETMRIQGRHASAQLIRIRECRPTPAVRDAFALGTDEDVIEVKRVRHLDRSPVLVDVSYFPLDIGRRLYGRDLTHDIFSLMENELGIRLGSADLKIEASISDRESRKLLDIRAGAPVLKVERLTFDAVGRPIDFEYLTYRGDIYQYQLRIRRT